MGNTTYTSSYQLKLIGTGREAGTWGASANENMARIEAMAGKAVTVALDAMPTGSTSADAGNSWTAIWVTLDTADTTTAQSGSEGRSSIVEVTGTTSSDPTLSIRGSSSGEFPSRLVYVKNSVSGSRPLVIDGGGAATVTIRNGNWALIALLPSDTGNLSAGALNVLSGLQLGSMSLDSGSTIEMTAGSNVIEIPDTEAAALTITDGTDPFLRFDTTNETMDILKDMSLIDRAAATLFLLPDGLPTALKFQDASARDYITLNTGPGTTSVDITQAFILRNASMLSIADLAWVMSNDSIASLVLSSSSGELLRFDTRTSDKVIQSAVRMEAPDVMLTGTDAYIAFQTSEATASDNYGIRNNAGVVQVKHSGNSWATPITSSMTSGGGAYFASTVNLGAFAAGAMPANWTATEAHLLVTTPKMVRAVYRCRATNLSYAVGDEISVDAVQGYDGGGASGNRDGITYGANATNLFVNSRWDSSGSYNNFWLVPKGGGVKVEANRLNWDLYIYAWK